MPAVPQQGVRHQSVQFGFWRLCAKASLCVQALAASLPLLGALPLCRAPGVRLLCLLVSALAPAGMRALFCFSKTFRNLTL